MRISVVEIEVPNAESDNGYRRHLVCRSERWPNRSVFRLAWFPRLLHASPQERKNWRLIGKGQGIHWAELDEDISVEGLLAGKPSGESQSSFQKWLAGRRSRLAKRSSRRSRRS